MVLFQQSRNCFRYLPDNDTEEDILGWNPSLGRYLLKELRLNLKFSEQILEADDGPLKQFMAPMVDLGTYEFKKLNTGDITPE